MIRKMNDGQTLTFAEMTLILNKGLVSVGMGTTSYSELDKPANPDTGSSRRARFMCRGPRRDDI